MSPVFANKPSPKKRRSDDRSSALVFFLCVLIASACGGKTQVQGASSETIVGVRDIPLTREDYVAGRVAFANPPEVSLSAEIIDYRCATSSRETCDGIDNNCDGQVDEECGFSAGSLQITLAWDGNADLDLWVTDPSGETISHHHKRAASGGVMDQEGRGQCSRWTRHRGIENVFWKRREPPTGTYQVTVHYWGECATAIGPTKVKVSIGVGRKQLRAVGATMVPNQKLEIASFILTRTAGIE